MGIRCWPWKKKCSDKTATAADSTTVPAGSVDQRAMGKRCWPWKKKSSDKTATAADSTTVPADDQRAMGIKCWAWKKKSSNKTATAADLTTVPADLVDQKYQKENKLLTDRLMAMEEETKMLKEALANCKNELQTSRSIHIKTACKLQSLEAQMICPGEHNSPPKPLYGSMLSQNASIPPSSTSLSEDGNDGAVDTPDISIKLESKNDNADAQTEMTNKDLVKKYAIAAEEAVSGWEKAVVEVAALKTLLESVTLMKFAAEGRASNLDGALKECMRQITTLKEDYEHKLCKSAAEKSEVQAECQRLRGLVRKKLPGPAALAQMKLEVKSLGRDSGETRLRRSPIKPSTPHMSTFTGFSLDGIQKYEKEIQQWLTAQ